MPDVSVEISCPECGSSHLLAMTAFRDASPDMIETMKKIMAVEAESAKQHREIKRALAQMRWAFFAVAGGLCFSAGLYAIGPEMISRWAGVTANLTGALIAMVCGAFTADLKLWTARI